MYYIYNTFHYKIQTTIVAVTMPTIVVIIIHIQPLSSPLLLKNPPHTFTFIPVLPTSLSSRNRSISNTFRHILPRVAPVCGGMHYHKTGVPWHTNNIFVIVLFLLILSPNVLFYKGFRGVW